MYEEATVGVSGQTVLQVERVRSKTMMKSIVE